MRAATSIFLLLLAPVTAAKDQPVLRPQGPWVVEAEENLCVLSHGFGDKDKPTQVGFQPLLGTPSMDVIIVSPKTAGDQREGAGDIFLDAGQPPVRGDYFSILLEGGRRYTRLSVPNDIFDRLNTTTQLRIRATPVDITLHLPSTAKARPLFDKCQADLLKSWGVDADALLPGRAPTVIGNAGKYFDSSSYPKDAAINGYVGRVVTILQVNTEGRVTRCRVVSSAGKLLNDATCANAMAIRFRPPTDSAGRPIPSIGVLPVRWQM